MRLLSGSAKETKEAGRKLGRLLKAGQAVCLYGDLGAGKTTFIKGVASALGIDEREVMSASFIIVSVHKGTMPLYHIDLYRLEENDVEDTGVYDYIGEDGVAVIEWAEKLEVENAVKVRINFLSGGEREIIIEGVDEKDWHNMQKRKARAA